jgi:hypothetical protein
MYILFITTIMTEGNRRNQVSDEGAGLAAKFVDSTEGNRRNQVSDEGAGLAAKFGDSTEALQ